MMDWADGWPVDQKPDSGGMSGGPNKLVIHTTEGGWEGAYTVLDRNNNWPHLMCEPWPGGRKVQAVPFSHAAKSLMNKPGGVETNRDGAIQVELIGFAANTQDWSDADVDYLGALFRPIVQGLGIGLHAPEFFGQDAGFIVASASAPQRMAFGVWDAFDGICGHQHVPENDHWDPGKFRIDRFLAALNPAAPTPPPLRGSSMPARIETPDGQENLFVIVGETLVTKYLPLGGTWGSFNITDGCKPNSTPTVRVGYDGDPNRIDVYADAPLGLVHAWFAGGTWHHEPL